MIQIHTDPKLNKQHLFTFTEHFISYLEKKKDLYIEVEFRN